MLRLYQLLEPLPVAIGPPLFRDLCWLWIRAYRLTGRLLLTIALVPLLEHWALRCHQALAADLAQQQRDMRRLQLEL